MTLVDALKFTVDDLQAKTLEELQELHSILSASKQKRARLQADLVAGIISAKKKEAKVAETETQAVENSKKRKATVKKKAQADEKQAKADAQADEKQADEKQAQALKKKVTKKKATAKKAQAEEKALEEMSREELLQYVKQLQEQKAREVFPKTVEGKKVRFVQVKLETIHDIQKVLLEKPYQLYLFADERLNELTQFLVLFANDEVIVLLDRNHQRNSTVTIKTDQLKADHIVFAKEGKFACRFYIREAKK